MRDGDKVILWGDRLQEINYAITKVSYFRVLEIENISDKGIELTYLITVKSYLIITTINFL